jgi:alkylmercury lyase
MRDIPLQDIIDAHIDAAAHMQDDESFLALDQFLLLRGSGPVDPQRLSIAMRRTLPEMEPLLQSSGLVVGPDGYIHLSPGPHQMHLDGETLFGWCALDTLLLPQLVGHAARVVSTCSATGRPIHFTVTEQGIVQDLDPQSAVLSLLLPGQATNICNAQEAICAYGHFFVDREHALNWPDLHAEAVLLSVEDAAYLACEIANVSRQYAEKGVN